MENRMKFRNKLAYGVGDFGSNFCWTFVSSFALIYFTDTVGVGAAAVATLLMAAKVLDGFTDVVMGGLIDRTRSKMGKARPWLFWSTFPLVILLIMLFSVPAGFSPLAKNIYIFIIYTLLGAVCYTASNISYNALVSLATDNPKERVSMGSIRFICAVIAGMALMSLTPALVTMTGGGQKGYTAVSLIYGLVFCAFTMITVFGVREMKPAEKAAGSEAAGSSAPAEKQEKFSFGKSMVLLVKNKYFLIMLGIYLVNYTISGVSGSVGIYYTSYVLNNPGLLGVLSIAGIIPMIIVLPITPKLTAKFGMRNACLYGSIISIAGAVIKMFSNNSVPVIMLGSFISAAGMAPLIGTMYALVAEIAEYAFLKFKIRMDGTIYSCSSVGIKVGSGLGTALVGWLLAAGRYDGAAAVQTQSAVATIQGLYLIAPVAGAVLVTLLLALLKVEKTNAELKVQA